MRFFRLVRRRAPLRCDSGVARSAGVPTARWRAGAARGKPLHLLSSRRAATIELRADRRHVPGTSEDRAGSGWRRKRCGGERRCAASGVDSRAATDRCGARWREWRAPTNTGCGVHRRVEGAAAGAARDAAIAHARDRGVRHVPRQAYRVRQSVFPRAVSFPTLPVDPCRQCRQRFCRVRAIDPATHGRTGSTRTRR